ncbi:hypothetical protein-transmembrane prediction [Rhodopirellula baltica SH 1]|uniref:Uncharacterized protein n=1 Tax=Rhodopirellula baltica (strain DSM 10527 / NCIMB 13988 / SH1) TaxID=243090 RepID=Q7UQQ7_RHOBA|nr:hypothetical protein-transmembrane prediction [Rhodopirellula baltica SH 1]
MSRAMSRAICLRSSFDSAEYRSLGMFSASLLFGFCLINLGFDLIEHGFFIVEFTGIQLPDTPLNLTSQLFASHQQLYALDNGILLRGESSLGDKTFHKIVDFARQVEIHGFTPMGRGASHGFYAEALRSHLRSDSGLDLIVQ